MKRIRNQESGIRNWPILFLLVSCFLILDSAIAHAQSVDILWQGDSYVPPFYRGLKHWSTQSLITLVAIPQGLTDTQYINYKWIRDGRVLGSLSGVGRNNLTFFDTVLSKTREIKVEIYDSGGDFITGRSINLTPEMPQLVVYENNPLYGFMFHREIVGSYRLDGEEITFAAFPFFYTGKSRGDSALSYEWRTNSGGIDNTNSATYRVPKDASGTSQISVQATNANKILQDSSTGFIVEFGNQ
jgi:hypothetical protein